MRYHRAKTKGSTFFFTVVTFNQMRILTEKSDVDLLRASLKHVNISTIIRFITNTLHFQKAGHIQFHRYEHERKYDSVLGMGSEIASRIGFLANDPSVG